jgi:thiol-disulfide isomerase/thioredoxin
MRSFRTRCLVAIITGLVVAGCGSGDDTTGTTASPAGAPAWTSTEIVNVDGASFRFTDFVGRPVFIEAFATWCPTCRAQLGDTQAAAAAQGANAVFVALSVETTLSGDAVASYAKDNGFTDIRFAVMTPQLLAALVKQYGNSVANPPSTPHLVIDRDGIAGAFETGRISQSAIATAMQPASASATTTTPR